MSLGRVKASDKKTTSGNTACTSRMSHAQNGMGLVWGLSTRKIRTPCSIQKTRTLRASSHSASRSRQKKSSG